MNRAAFLENVYILGLKYGASVTSWFRSDIHNAAVGGVAHSAHRFGLGIDLVFDAPRSPERDALFVEDARRLGIKVIVEGDHLHLQPLTWEPA